MAILANITELVADTRDIINETAEGFWTDAYIERQLEKSHQIISAKIKMVSMIWTVSLVTGTPSTGEAQIVDDREILLPSSFIAIDDGGVYYNSDVCPPTTIKEIKHTNKDWLDAEGTPHRYYLRGDMLGFDQKISSGNIVRIYGIKMPDEISAAQAPFDNDYRLTAYRYLLVNYAVGKCWEKKGEMTKFAFYLQPGVGSFWVGLQEMRAELTEDLDEDNGMILSENLARPHSTY